MPARFVNLDDDTPLLLPPNLRDWVAEDHLVHFIMDAVSLLDLSAAHVNHSGSGDEQYPPPMLLGLLLHGYATGTFSSRRIEKNTCEQVAVRLLCADRHPDHDTICTFRVRHRALLASAFHQVLESAARVRVLHVGKVTLALDGSKVPANASKHSAVSHRQEMAAFVEKQARREAQAASGKKPRGRAPRPPSEAPEAKDQFNFTNPESRLMKTADGFAQSYNAQAAVEIDSRLIVSQAVSDAPNDRGGGWG